MGGRGKGRWVIFAHWVIMHTVTHTCTHTSLLLEQRPQGPLKPGSERHWPRTHSPWLLVVGVRTKPARRPTSNSQMACMGVGEVTVPAPITPSDTYTEGSTVYATTFLPTAFVASLGSEPDQMPHPELAEPSKASRIMMCEFVTVEEKSVGGY